MSDRASGLRREIVTMVRYGAVGLTNTALYLVLSGGMLALGVHPAVASVVAYGIAAVFSFLVNQGWTFQLSTPRPYAFARFALVQVVSAGTLTVGALLLTDLTGVGPFLAEVCVLPFVVAAAYVVNRNWVFGGGAVADA